MLTEAYKDNPTVRISAAGTTALIVYAGPEELIEITTRILKITEEKGVRTEALDVGSLDATATAAMMTELYGDPTKTGAPTIKAQVERNAIIVHGNAEQIAAVKK